MKLTKRARILLQEMATAEHVTLRVVANEIPPVVAELIEARAIHFPGGETEENQLRCQITTRGLELYRALECNHGL